MSVNSGLKATKIIGQRKAFYRQRIPLNLQPTRKIPLNLQPTRITSQSNTLIDNIFSNVIDLDIISSNLTATISDHLPQFAVIPNMFDNILGNKSNFYERDWSKFDQ